MYTSIVPPPTTSLLYNSSRSFLPAPILPLKVIKEKLLKTNFFCLNPKGEEVVSTFFQQCQKCIPPDTSCLSSGDQKILSNENASIHILLLFLILESGRL